MTEKKEFSFNDHLICKDCKESFSLGQAKELEHGLKFHQRDGIVIEAICPYCRSTALYNKAKDLWKNNSEQESEEIKKLHFRLAEVTASRETYKMLYESMLVQIGDLVRNAQQSQQQSQTQNGSKMEAIK